MDTHGRVVYVDFNTLVIPILYMYGKGVPVPRGSITLYMYIVLSCMIFLTECGGKMHLREGEYEKAHTDFFEAFKNYDESGSPR